MGQAVSGAVYSPDAVFEPLGESRVSDPIVLRIVRPYDHVDAFVLAEGWTLNRRGMVLLDQPALPRDTVVRFDVSLRSGERVMLAEGVVVGFAAANDRRPQALKVRFTRFGASTKTFIDRVVEQQDAGRVARSATAEVEVVSAPPPYSSPRTTTAELDAYVREHPPSEAPPSLTRAVPTSALATDTARTSAAPPAVVPVTDTTIIEGTPEKAPSKPRSTPVVSGRSAARVVPAPPDRERLLDSLRRRHAARRSGGS